MRLTNFTRDTKAEGSRPVAGDQAMDSCPVDVDRAKDSWPVDGGFAMDSRPVNGDWAKDSCPVDGGFTKDSRPVACGFTKDSRPVDGDRAGAVPLWLRKLEQKMPDSLAVFEIRVLMHMTASAMKVKEPSLKARSFKAPSFKAPSLRGCSSRGCSSRGRSSRGRSLIGRSRKSCLQEYQRYTVSCLENRTGEELSALRKAMYKKAFTVGKMLGNLPGLSNDVAKMHLIKLLYRNIGIRILGSLPGEIRIPRCSFSRFYTPQMCAVMSGMDAGIICGIFGGGSLTFNERLTQGSPACRAVYCLYPLS